MRYHWTLRYLDIPSGLSSLAVENSIIPQLPLKSPISCFTIRRDEITYLLIKTPHRGVFGAGKFYVWDFSGVGLKTMVYPQILRHDYKDSKSFIFTCIHLFLVRFNRSLNIFEYGRMILWLSFSHFTKCNTPHFYFVHVLSMKQKKIEFILEQET